MGRPLHTSSMSEAPPRDSLAEPDDDEIDRLNAAHFKKVRETQQVVLREKPAPAAQSSRAGGSSAIAQAVFGAALAAVYTGVPISLSGSIFNDPARGALPPRLAQKKRRKIQEID